MCIQSRDKHVSLTFSVIFDRITHDCVIDAERKRKEIKDVLVSDESNKAMIFRLFGKIDSTNSNHCNATLGS